MKGYKNSMEHLRPTSATIDLDALTRNVGRVRSSLKPGCMVLAAVKGDAYGHGAVRCAKVLETAGVEWFGVALVEEGIELREAGIAASILCLGGAGPMGADAAVAYGLTPLISDLGEAARLNAAAKTAGTRINVHVKVDTGMGRLGVPLHHWPLFLDRIADMDRVSIEGVASHFSESEHPEGSVTTLEQARKFNEALETARRRGVEPAIRHIANSGAILQHPEQALDMVRPGLLLYGYDPGFPTPRIPVEPVMSLTTQVLVVRDLPVGVGVSYGGNFVTRRPSRVATLPVGYADGYSRAMSGRAQVLVHGVRAPVLGRICMDMCMVDVTDVPERVQVGDTVVLVGHDGDSSITAYDLAEWASTIPYEILTGFSRRVPRRS